MAWGLMKLIEGFLIFSQRLLGMRREVDKPCVYDG